MDKIDEDLDAAILAQDPEKLKDWLTNHAETLTWTQANKIVPVVGALINTNGQVCLDLLRVVAPMMGAYFTSHNNSLEGMNPVLVKLIKHLQFRLVPIYKQKFRLLDLFSGNTSGGTVQEEAEEVADLFRKKGNNDLIDNIDTLAKAVPTSRASRVLAVLEVAAMLAPEVQDIPALRYKVWHQNHSAMIMLGEGRPSSFLGSASSWGDEETSSSEEPCTPEVSEARFCRDDGSE